MALALLLAASLSAQPARLVLGKDAGAELSLNASAKAEVTFSSSAGEVGEAERKGDRWTARFTPPKLHAPSVALILAQVDEGGERDLYWLAIPLAGADTMEIETRPGARVEAEVAGEKIGPVTADHKGIARLPMVVPPGVEKATLRITDKLGNTSEKPLDLEPPPFTRVRLAAREDAAHEGGVLELEIFAVKPDGTPDDDAKPLVLSDQGAAQVRRRIGPGVYLAEFEPPAGKTGGTASLSARAEGQTASLDVPLQPRAPARLWQSGMVPQRPWGFSGGPIGALGVAFDGGIDGGLLVEGALRLKNLPLEALLEIGGIWFAEVTQGAGPGTTYASSHAWLGRVGLRASMLLGHGVDAHAAVLLGVQDQVVHVRSVVGNATSDDSTAALQLAAALGASLRAGPGRLLVQLQLDSSPSGEAGLQGSLGGAQLQVGYLFPLR